MRIWVSLVLAIAISSVLSAQSRPEPAEQKAAMQKLSFLEGTWVGPAVVTRGSGAPIQLEQTEVVEYRLGGLILLIEGTGRNAEGTVEFNAVAVVNYDPASKTYRIRAWSAGNFVETELKVGERTFEWGFEAGPATVLNRMKVDEQGRWSEVSDVTVGGRNVQHTEMTLPRKAKQSVQ